MRVLNLTIAALLVLSLATPVAAQQAARTLDGQSTIVNPLCTARPRTPKGTVLTQVIIKAAGGTVESCTWSTLDYTDPAILRQQRAQAYAQERARADEQVRECALALVARYNMYLFDAKLACMGAAPMPYGYSYGGGYATPRYRDPSNPFH